MKRKREDMNITYLWHYCHGHISESRINKLYKKKILTCMIMNHWELVNFISWMIKTLFSRHGERTNELLALVHTDVCRPMATQAREGYSYFINFTDDLSRLGYVYLIKHKSKAFDKFKEYQSMVEK